NLAIPVRAISAVPLPSLNSFAISSGEMLGSSVQYRLAPSLTLFPKSLADIPNPVCQDFVLTSGYFDKVINRSFADFLPYRQFISGRSFVPCRISICSILQKLLITNLFRVSEVA